MWDWVIRAKRVTNLLPVLEAILAGFKTRFSDDEKINIAIADEQNQIA
jgi:hypothetical protein